MDLVFPFDRFIFVADDASSRTPRIESNWAIGRSLLRSQAARSVFLRYCALRAGRSGQVTVFRHVRVSVHSM
jgi:hypothetical protein